MAEQGQGGAVNATGPAGMTTLGGLLELCRETTGSDAELVAVPEAELLAAGVQPWQDLPLWLPADLAPTAWDGDTSRARELGLPSRPLAGSLADTWAHQRTAGTPTPPAGRTLPGLSPEREAQLLAGR